METVCQPSLKHAMSEGKGILPSLYTAANAISDETSLMESALKLSALHESERKAVTARVQPKFGETCETHGKTKGRN